MKQIKRLILLIGFVPCFIVGGITWVFTGKDPIDLQEEFICWCTS